MSADRCNSALSPLKGKSRVWLVIIFNYTADSKLGDFSETNFEDFKWRDQRKLHETHSKISLPNP